MESGNALDFAGGVPIAHLPDGGVLQGNVGGEDVVLARRGEEFFAVGAFCTHYGGPLAKGLVVGDELRCHLHHACFSLRTGGPLRPPAFDAIPCWRVERVGQSLLVREKLPPGARKRGVTSTKSPEPPVSVLIIGGGGAGLTAADTLRREGYDAPVAIAPMFNRKTCMAARSIP